MPSMMLSYYGGGHYDSIVGDEHAVNLLRSVPGEHEDQTIRRMQFASSADLRNARAVGTVAEGTESISDVEREAVNFTLGLSRNDQLGWATEDLDACLLMAMEMKGDSKDAVMGLPFIGTPAVAEGKVSGYGTLPTSLNDYIAQNPSLIDAASDIAAVQHDLLKTVAEQSEREYLDKAILSSLQDDSKLTDEELLELAKQESIKNYEASIVADSFGDRKQHKDEDDADLSMALKLSAMDEEEVLRYALEQSMYSRHQLPVSSTSSSSSSAAVGASPNDGYGVASENKLGLDYALEDEDALLQAAINESMMGQFVAPPKYEASNRNHSAAASSSQISHGVGDVGLGTKEENYDTDDEDLKLALAESLKSMK
jgi:hypothetical protein